MKQNNITGNPPKRFRKTTDSDHQFPVAQNILNRNFLTDRPNAVWVTDISVPQQAA
jgi:putative transposase